MEELTGILLCGGKSQRMGTDKALLELQNQPMVRYPLKKLEATCSEILISANDNRLDFLGYRVVPDEIKNIGPIGGLYSCLKQSIHELNFVLACDMPLITGSLLRKMLQMAQSYDVVVPLVNQRAEPLYGLYHKNIVASIKYFIDQETYALHKLLSYMNVCYIKPEPEDALELFNINTPAGILNYGQLSGSILS